MARKPTTRSGTVLESLMKAVRAQYASDPSGAGVVMAHLGDKAPPCYVSICRYRAPMGGGKEVVLARRGDTFEQAILAAAKAFHERFAAPQSSLEALAAMLEES